MMQDIKKHKVAYSILALIAIVFIAGVFYLRHFPTYMLFLTLGFGILYLVWGILHHALEDKLTGKIVLEYILVTALGIVIMSTLLL